MSYRMRGEGGGRSVHNLIVDVRGQKLFVWPSMSQNTFELWLDDALIAVGERRIQLKNRLAGAGNQATRFAMRDRGITADQVLRELHDHSDSALPPALEK